MSINTISAGQKDWVNIINNNFTQIGEPITQTELTTLNGWLPLDSKQCYAKKIPLPNGTSLKVINLAIENKSVPAGARYAPVVALSEDLKASVARPIGCVNDVGVDGHFQGTINWWFTAEGLTANYNPINGNSGPFDITIWTTIMYI